MSPVLPEDRKSELRKKLRLKLRRIPEPLKRKKSRVILDRILSSKVFRNSSSILAYSAIPGEVQTQELILKSLFLKKNVFLPAVNSRRREISIYRIKRWPADVRKGVFGILEPRRLRSRRGIPAQLDLVLAPGLGFDRQGGRLGRGLGFFDRLLKKTKKAHKLGLAFREQIVKKVPLERHDIKMNQVITD